MEINKDSIVISVCGIKSDITLKRLVDIISGDLDTSIELNEVIEHFNEGDDFFSPGDYDIENREGNLLFSSNLGSDEDVSFLLEAIFEEEFLIMESTRFKFNVDDPELSKMDFVHNTIFNNGEEIFFQMTKNHDEQDISKINKDNFLTETDKKKIQKINEDNKVYNNNYIYYFIKKSDFNIEKWWLGWKDDNA